MIKHLYVPYDPKNLGCNIYKTSTYNRNLRVPGVLEVPDEWATTNFPTIMNDSNWIEINPNVVSAKNVSLHYP